MNLKELTQWYNFTGKTVVITGGTGVLGGEMACALVGCGANVAVLDRNPNLPEELKKPMDAGPGKYMVIYGDVLARESLEKAAADSGAAAEQINRSASELSVQAEMLNAEVNRFLAIDGQSRERLVVVPGQFRASTDGTPTVGTQRQSPPPWVRADGLSASTATRA